MPLSLQSLAVLVYLCELESRKKSASLNGSAESTTGQGGQRDWVVVTIQDTGIGIDPEQQQKLFQPFVMVDGSRTRSVGGNGLGLAISRRIMESMIGGVTLHSAGKNQGTAVMISLPVYQQVKFLFDQPRLGNGKWKCQKFMSDFLNLKSQT